MATVELIPRAKRALVLELLIPAEPVPKARARVRRGQGGYTPARTRSAETYIEILARGRCQTPVRDPIIVEADFFLGNARRVDVDNLLKLVLDACNGIVWHDDAQIVELYAHKHVDRENPRTELRVWRTLEAE